MPVQFLERFKSLPHFGGARRRALVAKRRKSRKFRSFDLRLAPSALPTVYRLLGEGGPAAIVRFVVSIVVDAIN